MYYVCMMLVYSSRLNVIYVVLMHLHAFLCDMSLQIALMITYYDGIGTDVKCQKQVQLCAPVSGI